MGSDVCELWGCPRGKGHHSRLPVGLLFCPRRTALPELGNVPAWALGLAHSSTQQLSSLLSSQTLENMANIWSSIGSYVKYQAAAQEDVICLKSRQGCQSFSRNFDLSQSTAHIADLRYSGSMDFWHLGLLLCSCWPIPKVLPGQYGTLLMRVKILNLKSIRVLLVSLILGFLSKRCLDCSYRDSIEMHWGKNLIWEREVCRKPSVLRFLSLFICFCNYLFPPNVFSYFGVSVFILSPLHFSW